MTILEQNFLNLVPKWLGEIADGLYKIEWELSEIRKAVQDKKEEN